MSNAAQSSKQALSKLHGLVAIYKPQSLPCAKVVQKVKSALLDDLNQNYSHGHVHKQFYLVNWKKDGQLLEQTLLKPFAVTATEAGYLMDSSARFESHSQINDDNSVSTNFLTLQQNLTEVAFSFDNGSLNVPKPRLESVSEDGNLAVVSLPSIADHPLVRGPFHRHLCVKPVNYLDIFSSGILLLGITRHNFLERSLMASARRKHFRQVFKVLGEYGASHDNFCKLGKKVAECGFSHVDRTWLVKKLKFFTDDHKKMIRRQLKLDVGEYTNETFDRLLTSSNSLRRSVEVLHNISLLKLVLPFVELEMELSNSNGEFCRKALHQIALKQRSYAAALKVTLSQYGPIGIEDTLLVEEITVEKVLEKMRILNEKVNPSGVLEVSDSCGEKRKFKPKNTSEYAGSNLKYIFAE